MNMELVLKTRCLFSFENSSRGGIFRFSWPAGERSAAEIEICASCTLLADLVRHVTRLIFFFGFLSLRPSLLKNKNDFLGVSRVIGNLGRVLTEWLIQTLRLLSNNSIIFERTRVQMTEGGFPTEVLAPVTYSRGRFSQNHSFLENSPNFRPPYFWTHSGFQFSVESVRCASEAYVSHLSDMN